MMGAFGEQQQELICLIQRASPEKLLEVAKRIEPAEPVC